MSSVRRVLWALLALGLLAFSLGCFWAAGSASADEPAPAYAPPASPVEPSGPGEAPGCPGGLGAYEGEDPAVAAVYGLDADLVASCVVERYGLARVRERTYWSVAEAVGSAHLQEVGNELLSQIAEAPPSSGSALSPEVVESGFEAEKFALWFIAAVLVCGLGAYLLVRLVVFRDN